jgi:hypothetical protein
MKQAVAIRYERRLEIHHAFTAINALALRSSAVGPAWPPIHTLLPPSPEQVLQKLKRRALGKDVEENGDCRTGVRPRRPTACIALISH